MRFTRIILIIPVFLLFFITIGFAQPEKETGENKEKVGQNQQVEQKEIQEEEPGFWTTFFSLAPLERKKEDQRKWFFTLGGWYDRKLGNTDTMRTNGLFRIQFDDNIAEFELQYKYFYGESEKQQNENNGDGIIKVDYYFFPMLELFLFSQMEHNEIINLNFRNNSGLGAKFVFFRNVFWKTDISMAPLFEYEKYSGEEDDKQFRISFRYRIKMNLFGFMRLNFIFFYVPLITDFTEYRTSLIADVGFNITRDADEKGGLILKVGYVRKYNTFAVEGNDRLDQNIYAQIQLKL